MIFCFHYCFLTTRFALVNFIWGIFRVWLTVLVLIHIACSRYANLIYIICCSHLLILHIAYMWLMCQLCPVLRYIMMICSGLTIIWLLSCAGVGGFQTYYFVTIAVYISSIIVTSGTKCFTQTNVEGLAN